MRYKIASISLGFVSISATVLSYLLKYRDVEYWVMNKIQNSQNGIFFCINVFLNGNLNLEDSLGVENSWEVISPFILSTATSVI